MANQHHSCEKQIAGWRITYAPPGTPGQKARLEKVHVPPAPASTPVATIFFCPWCGSRLP